MKIFTTLILILVSFFVGRHYGMGNQELVYGDTGLPKNCRAIITENIKAFYNESISVEGLLGSISRNCGAEGYSWSER